METILLFNATGEQGTAISKRLNKSGHKIISPTRSEKNISVLKKRNIEAFLTDFSTESLVPIIKRADKVVLQIPAQISPSMMISLSNNIFHALKIGGNPKTVFVISSTVPKKLTNKKSPDARLIMKQNAQKLLPNITILSATEYLENFSTSYRQAILGKGMIPQTIPSDLPVNYLSWNDLAIYVERTLNSNVLVPGFYQIGGLEGITGEQLAKRLGLVIKKELRYHTLTHIELEGFLTSVVGQPLAGELAEFYAWQDNDGAELLNPDTKEIRQLLGIELVSFEEWAKEYFVPNEIK